MSAPELRPAPMAAPGHLCVYEAFASRAVVLVDPVTSAPEVSSRFGVTLLVISSAQSETSSGRAEHGP